MSLPKWREDWATNAGVVGVIVVTLTAVVLTVFLYVASLSRGHTTLLQGEPGRVAAAPGRGPGGVVTALPSPPATAPQRYSDPRYGFELMVPADWRRALVADEPRPALAADYDVVWEQPHTGARLALSAWDAGGVTSFPLWSALQGAGMQPVDGRASSNAVVAGRPALLLWSAETPTTPARWALFVARDGTYYRLAYAAHDGGGALMDYARALATLRWPGDADAPAMLPLRGLPESEYWPSERLFGRD